MLNLPYLRNNCYLPILLICFLTSRWVDLRVNNVMQNRTITAVYNNATAILNLNKLTTLPLHNSFTLPPFVPFIRNALCQARTAVKFVLLAFLKKYGTYNLNKSRLENRDDNLYTYTYSLNRREIHVSNVV